MPGPMFPMSLYSKFRSSSSGEVREHFGRHGEGEVVAPLAVVHEDHGEHRDRLGTVVLQHAPDGVGPEATRPPRPKHTLS